MLRFVRVPMAMLLMLTLAFTASAQDEKKEKRKEGAGRRNPADAMFQVRGVRLTEEQQKKLADIKKEYEPKVAEAMKKAELTADQRKAARDARGDKKGKEAREASEAATNRTTEQKAAQEQLTALRAEITKAIDGLLTDEQKAERAKRAEGRPGGKRKPKE